MLTSPTSLAALRALRDCTVIRARLFHPGYSTLVDRRLATATRFAQDNLFDGRPLRDFRLTERGLIVAEELLL